MAKNLLLEYSEELATKCELLCKSISGNSNTVFQLANPRQACMPISPKRSIPKALPICSPSLRLQEKSALKRRVG